MQGRKEDHYLRDVPLLKKRDFGTHFYTIGTF